MSTLSKQTTPLSILTMNLSCCYRTADSVQIAEPLELKGMTLEERLLSYDWQTKFQSFQDATRRGTFKPLCSNSKGVALTGMKVESHYPRILKNYREAIVPCSKKQLTNKLAILLRGDGDIGSPMDDNDESNAVERGQLVRNKVSRSSEGPAAGSSGAKSVSIALLVATIVFSFRWRKYDFNCQYIFC